MTPGQAIGIDVGGTKIAGGIVLASTGELRIVRRIPTRPDRGSDAVLTDAVELARGLAIEAEAQKLEVRGPSLFLFSCGFQKREQRIDLSFCQHSIK